MAINAGPDRRRPYAAAANVLGVLTRIRGRNLPDRIDNDFLRLAGIPEIVYGRVREALRFLGIVEEDGSPSDLLRSMHSAPEQEYRDLLAGTLRDAYREDFARVDPGKDTQVEIIDQFAPYQPKSQTQRMVMLFLGLCREAGMPVLDAPRERKMKASGRARGRVERGPQRQTEAAIPAARGQVTLPPRIDPNVLFGVTLEDMDSLPPGEFDTVWNALGLVVKARAQAHRNLEEISAQAARGAEEESAEARKV